MNSDTITDEKTMLGLLVVMQSLEELDALFQKADPALKRNPAVIARAMRRDLSLLQWADLSLRQDKTFLLKNLIINLEPPEKDSLSPDEVEAFRKKIKIACTQFCRAFDCIASEIKSNGNFILDLLRKPFCQFPSYIKGASESGLIDCFSSGIKEILDHINPNLKNNERFLLEMLEINHSMFFYVADELKKSRDFLRKALKKNSTVILSVDPELKNDPAFLLEMIEEAPGIFEHISPTLKSNKEFSFKALEKNLGVFTWIVDKDKTLVSNIIRNNPFALTNAPDCLQEDEEFLLSLIQEKPHLLWHFKYELSDNKTFVLKAVTRNGLALEYATDAMKSDPEIIEAAIRNNPEAEKYVIKGDHLRLPAQLPLSQDNDSSARVDVPHGKTASSNHTAGQPIKAKEQPGKAFPLVGSLVVGVGLGLLCSWVLGYSLGFSLGILAPLCCLGALAIHWLLRKRETDSDPDTRKTGSVSDSSSQKSTSNGIIPQPSAQIFSSEKSAAEPAPLSSPSPGPCPGHAS